MKAAEAKVQLDVSVSGDPMEMGLAQGSTLRDRIHEALLLVDQLEAFRLMKPAWMPYALFRGMCEFRAGRKLDRAFARTFPDARRRLEGICRGSGANLNTLYLLTAMESMLSERGDCTTIPAIGGCSALAVRGRRSANGEPVIVRNFDYIPLVQPLYIMRKSQPREGFQSLDFTMAPFAGSVDGINEKGLCITYNYAYTTDMPSEPSAPISIVIAEALQRCAKTQEAVAWIQSRPRWGGGILMLADADGEIASLELSSTRTKLRTPGPYEHVLFHTNTFWTDEMRKVQVHDDAVYTRRAPAGLRGHLLHESAIKRRIRFEQLLASDQPLDLNALSRIMADHGEDGKPADTTPCVHGPYWSTTASLQLFPRTRRIRVGFDSACRGQHVELAL